jgi:hypothetical protein
VLGLVDGCLLPASSGPTPDNASEWTDKGDWLKLAHSLEAESVFFVDNEPVLVLANLPEGEDEGAFFNRVWCMARPQVLFLAKEGELVVYKLSAPPVVGSEQPRSAARLLALAESVADIADRLAEFTRERIESGRLFGEERFGTGYYRADRALVHDLKIVRRRLTEGPDRLSDEVAHALIGRALFVRYLEDRKILVRDYFDNLARTKSSWARQLAAAPGPYCQAHHAELSFFRVLANREFTYAFFDRLAADFNGDTFPVSADEQREVKAPHLQLLRDLLTGAVNEDGQEQLFLSAYRFDIIPIELISSIYEEFYSARRGKGNTQSSYYTPPALADFLLGRALTDKVLAQKPRVTDASCGSGIFLVEAFRRIVRYRTFVQGRRLSQRELRVIMRDQIRGIDLNPDAVPVAAFSLYLAYLHYQEPREINETRRLPNLRWVEGRVARDPDQHLDILYAGNAFDAITSGDPVAHEHFGPASADIVVGNPPWGEVKPGDILGSEALTATRRWLAASPERVIGNDELSQAFVHLALELLADGGKAALLLSSGVLFKQHKKSRAFRKSWLQRSKLEHVVNFAHVRHIFFADPVRPSKQRGCLRTSEGTSPFISAIFEKGVPDSEWRFTYWSARRTKEIDHTRAVVVAKTDMHRLRQDDCLRHENLWKVYWWGNRRDEGLIRDMERFPSLWEISLAASPESEPAQGYTPGSVRAAPSWLNESGELRPKLLVRYGKLDLRQLSPAPTLVHRPGARSSFQGQRLVIRQGIGSDGIVARFADSAFCFSNSILNFGLGNLTPVQISLITGTVWSQLGKYFYWCTAGSWGLWHDQLHLHVAGRLPISLETNSDVSLRIHSIVAELQEIDPAPAGELSELDAAEGCRAAARLARIAQLEVELDEAVFDLYELNEADRDLVRDMCRYGLDFFYRKGESIAVQPVTLPSPARGLLRDLPSEPGDGLVGYLQVFIAQWNADLEQEGEMAWEVVHGPAGSGVLALLFSTVGKGANANWAEGTAPEAWRDVLTRLSKRSLVAAGTQKTIYTDTFVRAVGEHEILIIKRDEARHWTRSMAREDADATLSRAMQLADQTS